MLKSLQKIQIPKISLEFRRDLNNLMSVRRIRIATRCAEQNAVTSKYDAAYSEVRLVDYEFVSETLGIVLVAVIYCFVLLYMKFVVNSIVFNPELRQQFRLLCFMGVQIFLRLFLDTAIFVLRRHNCIFYVFSHMIILICINMLLIT